MEKKKKDANSKPRFSIMLKNLKAEFKALIWPDRKTLITQSVAVIVSALGLGFIIALLDTIIQFGLGFIL